MTMHAQPIHALVPGVGPFVGGVPEDRHAERVVQMQRAGQRNYKCIDTIGQASHLLATEAGGEQASFVAFDLRSLRAATLPGGRPSVTARARQT